MRIELARTTCDCKLCQVACTLLPGYLVPSDLEKLPQGNLLEWAKEHLRASPGFKVASTEKRFEGITIRVGTLVPARVSSGACHWYVGGRCEVHAVSPFGCAYFDEHQSDAEADKRRRLGLVLVRDDYQINGPYRRLWQHLWDLGLRGPEIFEYKIKMLATTRKIKEQEARKQRRKDRKKRR